MTFGSDKNAAIKHAGQTMTKMEQPLNMEAPAGGLSALNAGLGVFNKIKCAGIAHGRHGNFQRDFDGITHDCTSAFESWCFDIRAAWGRLLSENDGETIAIFANTNGLTTLAPPPMMLDEKGNRSIFDDVDA